MEAHYDIMKVNLSTRQSNDELIKDTTSGMTVMRHEDLRILIKWHKIGRN